MIRLNNISKQFGSLTAVDGISLTVNKGEIFGLVGPDGAGKTTTIRMITGLLDPSGGTLTLLGSQAPETVKGRLGYVPQKFSLYGDLTVMENIRVIGSLYGASSARVTELAREILTFTNLLPFQDRLADNLSGGMKQKLALAAGLMHKPDVFFLDEPTTGVDPVSRREFWQMLYRLNKEGMTVFVSTPYMDEAELCSRVAFMHHGRIISCDSPAALKTAYPFKVLELQAEGKKIKQHLEHCPLRDINAFGGKYHLITDDPAAAAAAVRSALGAAEIPVLALKEIRPTLEDVFVALASEVI
ncbi:abc transporter [Lucifera butyrica]|uniref:Abc transporter n=1 Tax=Lucifera butyrica TaxID=1351585 RepID=A0A498R846_9FIRM|nr:ABC transporter ATP-binding protein [Lucifera butyrica]VBB06353.1 abc transporter [Lucifera butyrica]